MQERSPESREMWRWATAVLSLAAAALVLVWRWRLRREKRKERVLLSASQVPAAVGIHPFKTARQLYDEMTGEQPDARDNEAAVVHGVENEQRAIAVYQTLRMDGARVTAGTGVRFYSATLPVLGFTDGLIWRGEVLEGVLEIKCRYSRTDEAVPYQRLCDMYYHLPQVHCYMEMTGASYCDLMSYTRRGSTVFRIQPDPQLLYLLRLAIERFCECVAKKTPPIEDAVLSDQIKTMCVNSDWTAPEQPPDWDLFE